MLPQAPTAPLARTLLVTFLAALAFGLPLAAAGLDQQPVEAAPEGANDPRAPGLGRLSVPAPHQGDAAVYLLADGDSAFAFAWAGTRTVPDRAGQPRTVDVVVTDGSFGQSGQPGGWKGMLTHDEFSDAAERRVSGSLMEGESNDGAPGCNVAPCERDEVSYKRAIVHTPPGFVGRTPCGLFNRVQASTIDLDLSATAPIALFDPCTWDPNGVESYRAVESWGNGTKVVRFVAVDANATVPEAWFSDAYPYPVALQVGDLWIELARFARGDAPLGSAGNPTAPSLPVATGPGGAMAEPASHPFPLSAAFAAAQAHEDAAELRTWMEGHPKSAIVFAFGSHGSGNEAEEWAWTVVLGDGKDAYPLEVTLRTKPLQTVVPGLPSQEPFLQTTIVYEGVAADGEGDGFASPGEAPPLPGVESLWSLWRASTAQSGEPHSWGFRLAPGGAWSAWGGRSEVYLQESDGPGVHIGGQQIPFGAGSMAGRNESLAVLTSAGSVRFEQDTKVLYPKGTAPTDPTATALPPSPAPASSSQAIDVRKAWVWSAPSAPAVAGAGFAVLAVGVLHHFFPGLLRLFSRVREDEALEHPLRAQLMALVQAQPGVHHKELARRAGRARGTVEHHLRKMEQLGLLRSRVAGGYRCYFQAGTDRRLVAAAPRMRSAGAQAVLRALAQGSTGDRGMSLSQAAGRAGIGVSTAHYHVMRLEEAGLLAAVRRPGLDARLELTELGRQALSSTS